MMRVDTRIMMDEENAKQRSRSGAFASLSRSQKAAERRTQININIAEAGSPESIVQLAVITFHFGLSFRPVRTCHPHNSP